MFVPFSIIYVYVRINYIMHVIALIKAYSFVCSIKTLVHLLPLFTAVWHIIYWSVCVCLHVYVCGYVKIILTSICPKCNTRQVCSHKILVIQ